MSEEFDLFERPSTVDDCIFSVRNYVNKLEREIVRLQESAPSDGWVHLSEMETSSYESYCWIVYKGRVTEAYRDHNCDYRFHKNSSNVYMTECITSVMLWEKPSPPVEQGE